MKNNVIIIVIDALSKWYIEQCKTEFSFFGKIEKNSLNYKNMYSMGPFTEAAVRGLWAGKKPLEARRNLSESCFSGKTFFQHYYENGYYIYMGELTPYFTYKSYFDNQIEREKREERGFEHIWNNRLDYYVHLFQTNNLQENDYADIEFILDEFFNAYYEAKTVKTEYLKYNQNKREYIAEIMREGELSSFYKSNYNQLLYDCTYRNIVCLDNQTKYVSLPNELEFLRLAKDKNNQFLLQMNEKFNCKSFIEKELGGTTNRCMHSNDDLISHLRGGNEKLPKLKKELTDFLNWIESNTGKIEKPFLAYIHNYDFHYPENFMNEDYENGQSYVDELKEKTEELRCMKNKNMSVAKQLTVKNIERCLETFFAKLAEKDILRNTKVILTADHGISNFMYPIDKKGERWNYTNINFHVPFYVVGNSVKPYNVEDFSTGIDAYNYILYAGDEEKKIENEIVQRECIGTAWMHGVPDFKRQRIRLGARNIAYSITCEAFVTQFFSSARILGIYNLLSDKDECVNLYGTKIDDPEFYRLYNYMEQQWYETIRMICSEPANADLFNSPHDVLNTERPSVISWIQFNRLICNKKVILYGDGECLTEMLLKSDFEIHEIWKEEREVRNYIAGRHLEKPNYDEVDDDTILVLCGYNELALVDQMRKYGVKNYIVANSIK